MRVLLVGMVVALAAGVGAGDAMRPVLAQPGPAMQPVWDAATDPSGAPAGLWSGPGPTPDYVIGTDWLPHEASPLVTAEVSPGDLQAAAPEPLPYVSAAYDDDPPAPTARYPSEQGDILAGVVVRSAVDAPDQPPSV